METLKKFWQPLEWSQETLSPLGILSLLMMGIMVFYFLLPISPADAGWTEAVVFVASGAIAIGQGVAMIAGGVAAAGAVVVSAPIVGGAVVVAGGAALVGIGVAYAVEEITKDSASELSATL